MHVLNFQIKGPDETVEMYNDLLPKVVETMKEVHRQTQLLYEEYGFTNLPWYAALVAACFIQCLTCASFPTRSRPNYFMVDPKKIPSLTLWSITAGLYFQS